MPTKPSVRYISSTNELPKGMSSTTIVVEDMDEARPFGQTISDLFQSGFTSTDYKAARAARYSKAERALAETVQYSLEHCSSTRDLQINALQQATSLLNAHIVDAKERVERLLPLLVNRQVEPDVLDSMLRQRWMDERRQYAAEQFSKALEKHLAALASQPTPLSGTCATKPSTAKPNATRNLDRFLDSSRQRVQVRRVCRRNAPASRPRQEKKHDFPRIHHHRHLLSLKLKSPDPRLSFIKPRTTEPADAPAVHTNINTEPSEAVPSPTSPPLQSLVPISETPEIDLPPTPSLSGTATIWYSSPRPTEEILEGFVVSMPDYVSDLLAGLDAAASSGLSPPPVHRLATPHALDPMLSVPPVPGPSVLPVRGPPLVLRQSPSRRRLSAILPDALSLRIGSPNHRVLPAGKRFSSPPPSGFLPRIHTHAEPILEEGGAPQLAGRISFSANHLPDMAGPGPEADVASSASQSTAGGGNLTIVARLRRRISVLGGKP